MVASYNHAGLDMISLIALKYVSMFFTPLSAKKLVGIFNIKNFYGKNM